MGQYRCKRVIAVHEFCFILRVYVLFFFSIFFLKKILSNGVSIIMIMCCFFFSAFKFEIYHLMVLVLIDIDSGFADAHSKFVSFLYYYHAKD